MLSLPKALRCPAWLLPAFPWGHTRDMVAGDIAGMGQKLSPSCWGGWQGAGMLGTGSTGMPLPLPGVRRSARLGVPGVTVPPSRSRGHGDQQQGEMGGRRRARLRPCPHQAAQLTHAERSAPPAASLAAVYKCLKLRAGPKFPPRQQLLSEFYSRVLVTERWSPPGLVLEGGSVCVGWG